MTGGGGIPPSPKGVNAAHEYFITQTGKKSKTTLKNFMGPGGRGPRKTNTLQINVKYLFVNLCIMLNNKFWQS